MIPDADQETDSESVAGRLLRSHRAAKIAQERQLLESGADPSFEIPGTGADARARLYPDSPRTSQGR